MQLLNTTTHPHHPERICIQVCIHETRRERRDRGTEAENVNEEEAGYRPVKYSPDFLPVNIN